MQLIKSCVTSVLSELKLKNFGFQHSPVEEFYQSQWQSGERSWIYLVYRWIWALFFVGLFAVCFALQLSGGKFFIFLTNWGIILCLLTNLIAAVLVTRWHFDLGGLRASNYKAGCCGNGGGSGNRSTAEAGGTTAKGDQRISGWVKCYWLLHGVTLSLALIITTTYWAFLHGKMNKPQRFPAISFSTHCLNSVFMLVDFWIVAFSVRILHTVYSMMLPILYCLFTVVYFFCGGTDEFDNPWVYPILDWTHPTRGIITFAGVFCLYVVYSLLLFLIYKIKRWLHNSLRIVWTPHAVGLI